MMLYKADDTGIVFHTGCDKDVCKQIIKNPNVEMCFYDQAAGVQVRVRGALEKADDDTLKDEIINHPSRAFLKHVRAAQGVSEEAFRNTIAVFRLKNGTANVWTFETNMAPKENIAL
jgi:pyridoxine/pyridoxamine 5'-phosphate oxidase